MVYVAEEEDMAAGAGERQEIFEGGGPRKREPQREWQGGRDRGSEREEVCICVSARVCMCVREREREERACVCGYMCVCVCMRERERSGPVAEDTVTPLALVIDVPPQVVEGDTTRRMSPDRNPFPDTVTDEPSFTVIVDGEKDETDGTVHACLLGFCLEMKTTLADWTHRQRAERWRTPPCTSCWSRSARRCNSWRPGSPPETR